MFAPLCLAAQVLYVPRHVANYFSQIISHSNYSSVIGAVILQCYSTNTAMEIAVSMHIQGVMDTSLYAGRIIINN